MYEMTDIMTADKVKTLMQPLLDKGCFFEYFYEKGGDSSCVYIYRFHRGRNYFDIREVSGGKELNFVVCTNGAFFFPPLQILYKQEYHAFKRKHFFRRATVNDRRALIAEVLNKELAKNKPDFFGIKLS